ncbi:uncharacterized protein CTRU02_211310 [Colletotrichum truncatum]|uniref:Uncharacterized protein n=1 Tax=Colletotrichum truncatum TaxID=5467 RepID=A0ACC3YRK2_COLTU|nr:uncharacterized protein CTRU02_02085 [Colletotrichum truncatum]KAF6799214.1 hypothetical protein CTRU02_02085 [Colletotrichum truncatum]
MMSAGPLPNPQKPPILLNLPWDVKEKIYDYYLAVDHNDFDETFQPMRKYFNQSESRQALPSLMLSCKSAYDDLRRRVHTTAIMRVRTHGHKDRRIGFAVHGTLRFERLRTLYLVVAMDYPNWNGWLTVFSEITQRSSNLTRLLIDWQPRPRHVAQVGWEAKVTEKKEREFLGILSRLKKLEVITFYGDVAKSWTERVKKVTPAVLISYNSRWWREPGQT